MLTIVGLGNPGDEYISSRHNVGREVVLFLGNKYEFPEWKNDNKSSALISSSEIFGQKVRLVLPETFMNKSGKAVSYFIKNLKQAESLLVIQDDMDLPLGVLKISYGRGSGGHKGIESIVRAIKTKDFMRLRVGISKESKGRAKKPSGEKAAQDFVLGHWGKKEKEEIKKIFKKVDSVIQILIEGGRESATNECNRK